jgi:hypothetical protein
MGMRLLERVTGAVFIVSLVSTSSWTVTSDASSPISSERNCTLSSLTVTQKSNAGLGHEWLILVVQNQSNRACKISGYPSIKVLLGSGPFSNQNGAAKRSKPGSSVSAIYKFDDYGGGVFSEVPGTRLAIPAVSLRPRGGSASSVIGWSGEGGGKACPWFRSITVGWRRSYVNLRVGPALLCGQIDVTPIVPGTTGDLNEGG